MIEPGLCWERRRLHDAIEARVSPDEEARLALHLGSCDTCREQMEALAADRSDWTSLRGLRSSAAANESEPQIDSWGGFADQPALGFLAPTDDPAMLGRLGSYEIQGLIGHGGMGIVLRAFDRALNRNVAVKVLAPQLAASAIARRRFAREAQAAAAVVHEHVVPIHTVAEFNGMPYLVMPYFPGKSLQRRIDETGPLALPEILRIGRQIAAGLAAAHAQGLVHRDIKPANILLENGVERVVITDFGLARTIDDASLTCSGVIAGTPQYMSPEQARGDVIDHRADLFSFGSVLYAMSTGRPPFRAETAIGVLRRICDDEPRPVRELNPEIPDWLASLIVRLHAKEPQSRYQHASHVAQLLERCLAHVQNPIALPLPAELRRRTPRKRRRVFRFLAWGGIALTAIAFLGSTAGFFGRGSDDAPDAGSRDRVAASTALVKEQSALASIPEEDLEGIQGRIESIRNDWSNLGGPSSADWTGRIAELRSHVERLQREMRDERL